MIYNWEDCVTDWVAVLAARGEEFHDGSPPGPVIVWETGRNV